MMTQPNDNLDRLPKTQWNKNTGENEDYCPQTSKTGKG